MLTGWPMNQLFAKSSINSPVTGSCKTPFISLFLFFEKLAVATHVKFLV